MSNDEIAKEIVIKLIDKDSLSFEQFPEAKTYVDIVCAAYKQIWNTANNPNE